MLCIALTLVFAGASMTSIVDRVQHEAGVTADHEHLPLSIIAFDASDHDGGHPEAMPPDDSGQAPGHQPAVENHNQGDTGAELTAPMAQAQARRPDEGRVEKEGTRT